MTTTLDKIVTVRAVDSSNVEAVIWRKKNKRGLVVAFHDGRYYFYRGVSRQRAVAMARSGSVGKYFIANIKGKYSYRKLG